MLEREKIRTLNEFVAYVRQEAPASELARFRDMAFDDLIQCHFGWGMWIRSDLLCPPDTAFWKHWVDQLELRPSPDTISCFLLDLLWYVERGRALDGDLVRELIETRRLDGFRDGPLSEEEMAALIGPSV